MSKANAINKRLVNDYIRLQNWLLSRQQDAGLALDYNDSADDMAEKSGYKQAIAETIAFMGDLMSKWPDLNAHRNSKYVKSGNDVE